MRAANVHFIANCNEWAWSRCPGLVLACLTECCSHLLLQYCNKSLKPHFDKNAEFFCFVDWIQISQQIILISRGVNTACSPYVECCPHFGSFSPLKRKILLKPLDFEQSVTIKVLKASLCPAAFLYQIFSTDLRFKASEPLDLANVI